VRLLQNPRVRCGRHQRGLQLGQPVGRPCRYSDAQLVDRGPPRGAFRRLACPSAISPASSRAVPWHYRRMASDSGLRGRRRRHAYVSSTDDSRPGPPASSRAGLAVLSRRDKTAASRRDSRLSAERRPGCGDGAAEPGAAAPICAPAGGRLADLPVMRPMTSTSPWRSPSRRCAPAP